MKKDSLSKIKLVPAKKSPGMLFDEKPAPKDEPAICLGLTFDNDEARRAHFAGEPRKKLKDPKFRKIEGFPIGGDDPDLIEGDIFRMAISVPEFGANPAEIPQVVPATEQATHHVTQQVTQQATQQVMKLLTACDGELARADLMQAVGIRDRVSFSRNYPEPALSGGLIEMTQPDSPKSPTQKYRITAKGRKLDLLKIDDREPLEAFVKSKELAHAAERRLCQRPEGSTLRPGQGHRQGAGTATCPASRRRPGDPGDPGGDEETLRGIHRSTRQWQGPSQGAD